MVVVHNDDDDDDNVVKVFWVCDSFHGDTDEVLPPTEDDDKVPVAPLPLRSREDNTAGDKKDLALLMRSRREQVAITDILFCFWLLVEVAN